MKQGPYKDKLVVRVNEEILDSDEAIVSTLGHEMHEVNAILKMFDQRDRIPISEISREINTRQFGSRPDNIHE
jgi:predicted transcriptional regulator